jgi:hypothetical protein
MALEPRLKSGSAPSNPYANRWRWWYAAISDAMIANPGATTNDIAASLGKAPTTISMISNTDLFRDYHAQRRQEFQKSHDFILSSKLGRVAEKGLDLLLEVMETKRTSVPLAQLVAITNSSLENLGYGPKAQPQAPVQVNVHQQVAVPVSAGALEEARDALRRSEAKQLQEPPTFEMLPEAALSGGAETALGGEGSALANEAPDGEAASPSVTGAEDTD